jgi:hypothetical protein
MQSTIASEIVDDTRGVVSPTPSATKSWSTSTEDEEVLILHHHDDIESLVSMHLLRIEHHKYEMVKMHAELWQEMYELHSDLRRHHQLLLNHVASQSKHSIFPTTVEEAKKTQCETRLERSSTRTGHTHAL